MLQISSIETIETVNIIFAARFFFFFKPKKIPSIIIFMSTVFFFNRAESGYVYTLATENYTDFMHNKIL